MAEWWSVDLLDRRDAQRATIGTALGGTLEWSIFRAVEGTGTLHLDLSRLDVEPHWLTDRVRIRHHDTGPHAGHDPNDQGEPVGVWLVTVPGMDTTQHGTRVTLSLADKTETLNSPVGRWLTVPALTPVVPLVQQIIRDRGESRTRVTPSALSTSTAMSWEPQDTWLTVVNDLLRSINYRSLWADWSGSLVVGPYVDPRSRGDARVYGPGAWRVLPEWRDEAEVYGLPTGFVVSVEGDEETPGFTAQADLPDDHPLSAESRGREVLVVEDHDAATLQVAQDIAARRLQESLQVTRNATLVHPMDGSLVDDLVAHPAGFEGAIVRRTISLGIGPVVEDTVRHIYTGGDTPWL